MITTTILVMVRAYLKQLFTFFDDFEIEDDKIVITLPNNGHFFNVNYDKVFAIVSQRVENIRDRVYDVHFTVKGINQLRDFTILK